MASNPATRHRGGLPWWPRAGVVALLSVGCTSWSPPPFSPSLNSDEACGPHVGQGVASASKQPRGIEEIIQEIQEGRRRYIRAAQCLTSDGTAAGAALIGLSSIALFKGITSPHVKDMAGLGVAGGATYLASGGAEADVGRRRQLYFAGAAALSCALRAAEPFRPSADDKTDLSKLVDAAAAAQGELLKPELELRQHDQSEQLDTKPGQRAAKDCALAPASCPDPGTNATEREMASFQTCKAMVARCTPSADSTVRKSTHPAVKAMIADLVKVRDDIEKLLNESTEVQARLRDEPGRIGTHVDGLQIQVADEASKTFPSTTALLNSLSGLKSAAFKVSEAPALSDAGSAPAQAAGQLHVSLQAARAAVKALPDVELTEARHKLQSASRAATKLRLALLLQKRRFDAANLDVQACVLTLPAAATTTATAAPVSPAPAATPAPAPTSAPQPTLVTSSVDPKLLASLLGLPASASGEQVQSAVKACQQQVLKRDSATGVQIDTETLQALLGERCKAVKP